MDIGEIFKRIRRILDGNFSYRKTILLLLGFLVFILYMLPSILRFLFFKPPRLPANDLANERLSLHLDQFYFQVSSCDANIIHKPPYQNERGFLPYVGNGYVGLSVDPESPLHIRQGRTLSLPVNFRPIVSVASDEWEVREATVTEYKTGVVTRFQNLHSETFGPIDISYQTYAHRTVPSLLMQDIKVTNPTSQDVIIELEQLGLNDWTTSTSRTLKMQHGEGEHEYLVIRGTVPVPKTMSVVPVTIVTLKIPQSLKVKAEGSTTLHVVTAVNYSEPLKLEDFNREVDRTQSSAIKTLKEAVTGNVRRFKESHVEVWKKLWLSGFGISHSKAENSLNGDHINATIYYVLSQSPAPLYELRTSDQKRFSILNDLEYSEGCFGGHSTLNADTLWSTLDNVDDINRVVQLWMLTLEKQGCHQLIRSGADADADGVMQAMLLSFGGLQFKNQHLEFNADPQHLHRDYHFRRLSYGNATHLNVSVIVQEEDYKAVIYSALDRSDKNYYACDAGCLDPPVQLGPDPIMFPVKRTDPLTAILYITSDKVHMEELKHTIHVKEVAMAPPHEHHVIAMHRHGHKWGGLPTVFWMTIVALIVIFHLFLFKLVINEYCGPDLKVRYRKFSDL